MKLTGIGGVWPAAVTPFGVDYVIDWPQLKAHFLDLAQKREVRAIVVNGHAGEVTSLTFDERKRIIETARTVVPSKIGVVAGVLADDTESACEEAREAEKAGADAILLFPPTLFAQGAELRPEMALRFVNDVAAACSAPIVLFQMSLASGLGYSRDTIIRICEEVSTVIAIKEGSGSVVAYEDNLRAIRALTRPITVLTTNNAWLLSSLAIGGDGILSGMGSVAADIQGDLYAAVRAGDWAGARRANDRLFPLTQVFYRAPLLDMHNRMKVALHHLGLLAYPAVRRPLLPLSEVEADRIRDALVEAGLMSARQAAE